MFVFKIPSMKILSIKECKKMKSNVYSLLLLLFLYLLVLDISIKSFTVHAFYVTFQNTFSQFSHLIVLLI